MHSMEVNSEFDSILSVGNRFEMTLPNILTLFRIFLIPLFVIAFFIPFKSSNWICAGIFALAAFTDWLDGFLARKMHQVSEFGAFLDPVADKLMVAVALILLVGAHANIFLTIPAMVIVGREIAISALREWMATAGSSRSIAVNYLGKAKTMIQMIAITLLLSQPAGLGNQIIMICGYILLYLAAIFTLWSMGLYLQAAWKELSSN